jgi:anti-anti-sigma regulatory factor
MSDSTQVALQMQGEQVILDISMSDQPTVTIEPVVAAYQKVVERKITDVIFNFRATRYLPNLVPLIHQIIDICPYDQKLRFTVGDDSHTLVQETVIPVNFKDGHRRWGFFTVVAVTGDVAILDLAQAEITTPAQEVLKEAYQIATDRQARTIIFNFSNYAPHISSAGISTLILILSDARAQGQRVIYAGVAPYYKKIFNLVGLPLFVDFYPSVDEALSHLAQSGKGGSLEV